MTQYKETNCKVCGKLFKPTTRGKVCYCCLKEKGKHTCVDCGKKVTKKSIRCSKCLYKFRTGENNPNYKDGSSKHKKGYVYIRCEGHPKAIRNGKYVLEHVVVMEKMLGRNLLPGENVHHKNGVRSDNRPENLELWVTSQPSGQRPEDLVKWAKEILERYE